MQSPIAGLSAVMVHLIPSEGNELSPVGEDWGIAAASASS